MHDPALISATVSSILDACPASSVLAAGEGRKALGEACHDIIDKCAELFDAEICAIWIKRGERAELEACVGLTRLWTLPIPFRKLQGGLSYRISTPEEIQDGIFDGITGWVASTGQEFSASSWDEVRAHPAYAGKPEQMGVWSEKRPFRCLFAIPLMHGKQRIGVLKVENKGTRQAHAAGFDETDKLLLRGLGSIFSATLFAALERPAPSELDDPPREPPPHELSLNELAVRFDLSHMARVMERFPRQITRALEIELPPLPEGPFDRVVVAGMGGSALPVDVLVDAFEERLRVPVSVCRHYRLPHGVDERTLVIGSSFSGGTEEVLEAMRGFPREARNIVVLTADKGGALSALAKLASTRGFPLVLIPAFEEPQGFQPRSAVGYFVTFLARILAGTGVMDDPAPELVRAQAFLAKLDVGPDAERIARWLVDKIPVVYTDDQHQRSVARIAKIKFNENAKRPAFFNAFPEANHNEMIGFSLPVARFGVLYLHDPASHPRIQQRYQVMKEAFAHAELSHMAFERWDMPGANRLERLFASMAFSERCAYNLALLDGFDPTPVKLVETFKELLLR